MAYGANDGSILGCKMDYTADLHSVVVYEGTVYLPNGGRSIVQSPISINLPTTLVSTWVYIYVYDTANGAALEYSTSGPSVPYQGSARTKFADQTRRWLGAVLTDANGAIVPFVHTGAGPTSNRIDYLPPSTLNIGTFALLAQGTSAGVQTVSTTSVIPVTVKNVRVQARNTASVVCYLSNPDFGNITATNYLREVYPNNSVVVDLAVSTVQAISYAYVSTILLGGLNLRMIGYSFER